MPLIKILEVADQLQKIGKFLETEAPATSMVLQGEVMRIRGLAGMRALAEYEERRDFARMVVENG